MTTLLQYVYSLILVSLFLCAVMQILADKYASYTGKVLALAGCGFLLPAFDGFVGNVSTGMLAAVVRAQTEAFGASGPLCAPSPPFHYWFDIGPAVTVLLLVVGATAHYAGIGSWRFTCEERRAARANDMEAEAKAARELRAFHVQGTLLNMRNHLVKGGLFSNTERFTEIETTTAVLVVGGEGGAVAKGVDLHMNGLGQVRIGDPGSRTYEPRVNMLGTAPGSAQPNAAG